MKGTSDEVLEWLTHHTEYAPLMQMSRQRLVGLRKRLRRTEVSEQVKEELLERLKNRVEALKCTEVCAVSGMCPTIRKVRDRYVLPAVIKDTKGRLFHETTFIKVVQHEKMLKDLNLTRVVRSGIDNGKLPSKEVVHEAVKRKHWSILEERMVLPSVWEVE